MTATDATTSMQSTPDHPSSVSIEQRLAARMARLGTESAFEVLARAQALERQGRTIIHLEIGEPDFPTPEAVVEAGVAALRGGATHYTPSPGILSLRETIAEELLLSRDVDATPDQIVVTPGAKPILFFTLLALVDEGDEVICPDPGFPIYESMIRYAGGTVVPVGFPEEQGFRLDIDGLRQAIGPRTKLIIINSPANPTGGVLEPTDLERIAEVAIAHDLLVLSDEIYSRMIYEGA
ncbi:MAG TPA: aminotransferase class I/II-fold pyridoxal phosphate-dependent enzyme, partial [Chloroflexota bacterium]|nr:aminotransferase class I/II-fold pyridoxal phosphate-dependent enzyme [Chloroflexota bacterium]